MTDQPPVVPAPTELGPPDPARPRTALVLGAGSDIALAVLGALSPASGGSLEAAVLAARRPADALEAARDAAEGVRFTIVGWDATEVHTHRPLVKLATDTLRRIDLVLCAVGMLGHHAGLGMSPEEIDEMVRANFAGPAAALSAAADALVTQGSGTIVVLSSVAGVRARRSNFAYGSSKAGLDTYAQGLGDALRPHGARVLVVRPGFVRSKMTEGLDPAPFHTDPQTVGAAVAAALGSRREVVSVPGLLGPLFGVLRSTPRPLWRRIAGDR